MTRLAVIGSSHMGTVRQSDAAIRAACPALEIGYFGMPGAPFQRISVDEAGILRVRADAAEADTIRAINGCDHFDLNGYDLIWVIGPRFGLGHILRPLLKLDILELGRTGAAQSVSWGLYQAHIRAEVDAITASMRAKLGGDARVTLTPAPYPAETARRRGPHHEPPLANILNHPGRDRIFAHYEAEIARSVAAAEFGHLAQPAATRSAPFATDPAYLRGAVDFRDGSAPAKDLRHMNAAYGLACFAAFAQLHPALGCSIPTSTDSEKDD